jgi:hypothetical protein
VKRTGGRAKRRHFFLCTDILVWGSVLWENINCIRCLSIILSANQNRWEVELTV